MSTWTEHAFPVANLELTPNFPGTRRKLARPFCWTPTRTFYFGGKRFIALYPCVAFETANFGWVLQKLHDRVVIGQE